MSKLSKTNIDFNQSFSESIKDYIVPSGYREFVIATPKPSTSKFKATSGVVYSSFEDRYRVVLTSTIKNSQKAYSQLNNKLHVLEMSIAEDHDTNIYRQKLDHMQHENDKLVAEIKDLREWRRKVEYLPVIGQLIRIKRFVNSRDNK
jgi:hypothetical protein